MTETAEVELESGRVSAPGTGLQNRTGEYNCFLNVVIQSLWHLPPFSHAVQAAAANHGKAVQLQTCSNPSVLKSALVEHLESNI